VQISLIVPSSKTVAVEMQNEFGSIPPVLVPMMGKIAFRRIMDSYQGQSIKAYIGIQENAEAVVDYFRFFPEESTNLVMLDPTESISDTLEQVIMSDPAILGGPSIINFADTIIADMDPVLIGKDFIGCSNTVETERWTLFKDTKGKVSDISDKEFRMDPENWRTFIGVWGVSNTRRFLEIMHRENEANKREAFYKTIKSYYNQSRETIFAESRDWMDCGHVDNYYLARRRLMNTRFFNKVRFGGSVSSLVKTSWETEKLANEINWYLTIPSDLRYYVPHIFDHSADNRKPFIEMEYYSYPSLDDCFVYARFDFDTWNKIFERLFSIIRIASKHVNMDPKIHEDLQQMYLDKTLQRLRTYVDESNDPSIEKMVWRSRDKKRSISMKEFQESLPGLIKKFGVYDVPTFQVIHGDLCFSNILYDSKHGITKLIDPRGAFGRPSVFGDVYYDLAKLSHSALGFYDFIMFDQYRIVEDKDRLPSIIWRASDYHDVIGKIFVRHLESNGYDLRRTRFLEALLFISMLPLHKDSPARQKTMLLRGFKILCDLLE